jgi:hypothetical protein
VHRQDLADDLAAPSISQSVVPSVLMRDTGLRTIDNVCTRIAIDRDSRRDLSGMADVGDNARPEHRHQHNHKDPDHVHGWQ